MKRSTKCSAFSVISAVNDDPILTLGSISEETGESCALPFQGFLEPFRSVRDGHLQHTVFGYVRLDELDKLNSS